MPHICSSINRNDNVFPDCIFLNTNKVRVCEHLSELDREREQKSGRRAKTHVCVILKNMFITNNKQNYFKVHFNVEIAMLQCYSHTQSSEVF